MENVNNFAIFVHAFSECENMVTGDYRPYLGNILDRFSKNLCLILQGPIIFQIYTTKIISQKISVLGENGLNFVINFETYIFTSILLRIQ